ENQSPSAGRDAGSRSCDIPAAPLRSGNPPATPPMPTSLGYAAAVRRCSPLRSRIACCRQRACKQQGQGSSPWPGTSPRQALLEPCARLALSFQFVLSPPAVTLLPCCLGAGRAFYPRKQNPPCRRVGQLPYPLFSE